MAVTEGNKADDCMSNACYHRDHHKTLCTSVSVWVLPEADREKRKTVQVVYQELKIEKQEKDRERQAMIKGSIIKQLLLWETELNPAEEALGAS